MSNRASFWAESLSLAIEALDTAPEIFRYLSTKVLDELGESLTISEQMSDEIASYGRPDHDVGARQEIVLLKRRIENDRLEHDKYVKILENEIGDLRRALRRAERDK